MGNKTRISYIFSPKAAKKLCDKRWVINKEEAIWMALAVWLAFFLYEAKSQSLRDKPIKEICGKIDTWAESLSRIIFFKKPTMQTAAICIFQSKDLAFNYAKAAL